MPSSSTSSTFLERSIFYHFKIVYARLSACRYDGAANIFTSWYSNLLEKPGDQLQSQAFADVRVWNDIAAHANKKKDSENIALIGNQIADVGAVLFQFGMSQEAATMCERAEQVYEWSKRLENEEDGTMRRS